MRVVLLVHAPQRRGAEVFAHDLSAALRRAGHEAMSCYVHDHRGAGRLPLAGEDVVLDGSWRSPRTLVRLEGALERFRPDVVQVSGADTVPLGALAATLAPRRTYCLVRRLIGDPGAWLRGALRRAAYRHLVAPRFDGFVAVSRASLEGLRALGAVPQPTTCLPRGVDLDSLRSTVARDDVRRAEGLAPTDPLIIFVGSLSREKRVDRLLRVARRLSDALPALRVWLVGDGPEREATRALAEQLGLGATVRLWGVRDDVGALLGAADLLLLTSDTEGIPGVVLEANAVGVPAVATRVGGVAECIDDGRTGLLADADDEAGLAAAALGLLRDGARRLELGQRARERVLAEFTIDPIAARYVAFYEQVQAWVAAGRPRRGGGA